MAKPHTPKENLSLDHLRANPRNPRRVERDKLKMLAASMRKFGDLGGIILNRTTGQLVGGHQRIEVMRDAKDFKIAQDRIFDEPDATGTVLEGRVFNGTLSFAYREVVWSDLDEQAANIAANQGAGIWDLPGLKDMINELDHHNWDLNLTLFDQEDLDNLFGGKEVVQDACADVGQDAGYKVTITCLDQSEQQSVLAQCNAHGWNCKPNNPT